MSEAPIRLAEALASRYRLDRELGQGGMATVYLAHDLKHDRDVALKVLRPELAAVLGRERFLAEIHLTAKLDHPHILTLIDSGETDGFLWYVVPFIRGESLRQKLAREKQLGVEDALAVARQIAGALDHAHRHGVIHRDVKPENILLHEGEAMLADFGIALAVRAAAGERLTETGLSVGTPPYMSPEQATAERQLDGRSDEYSLGVVLYEMLAGEPPFTGATGQAVIAKLMTVQPTPLRTLRDTVPESVDAAVARALAKVPADRFPTVAEFAAALAPEAVRQAVDAAPTSASAPLPVRRSHWTVMRWAAALLVVASGALLWSRSRQRKAPTLDRDLIAIAPFDVLDPKLEKLWREGMVDMLSWALDGAGSIRTVAPSVVIKRWTGRADAPSARNLGLRTGAELVAYGSLVSTGRDSVRATVSLLDARTGRPLGQIERRAAGADMDRLADSIAVGLLAELGQSRPVGYVRGSGLGGHSLPALKAFLQGEQWLRAEQNDSAFADYRRAIALDSAFQQAWRHAGWAAEFLDDTVYRSYYYAAARLNHGLSVRDSLLTTYDSIWAAMRAVPFPLRSPTHIRRLLATAGEAARRYPEDPEAWWDLFAVRDLPGVSRSDREVFETLDRLIALDSTFPMASEVAIPLALDLDGPARALVYLSAFRRAKGRDPPSLDARITEAALGGKRLPFERLLDSASADELTNVALWLGNWPDSADLSGMVLRSGRRGRNGQFLFQSSTTTGNVTGLHLLFRGQLREACADATIMDQRWRPYLLTWCGLLHGLSPDSVERMLASGWEAAQRSREPTDAWWLGYSALLWWADQRDTAKLERIESWMSASVRRDPSLSQRLPAEYYLASVRAYRDLARGDSARALERFQTLPDSLCPWCWMERFARARLELVNGSPREALRTMEYRNRAGFGNNGSNAARVLWALTRGEAAERVGERELAAKSYGFVVDAWQQGDSMLQPYVQQARDGLKRLTVEPRRQ